MTDPQQWNRYAYAGNNPLKNLDPTGLDYVVCGENNGRTFCGGNPISYEQLEAWAYLDSFTLQGPGSGSIYGPNGYVGWYYYPCGVICDEGGSGGSDSGGGDGGGGTGGV